MNVRTHLISCPRLIQHPPTMSNSYTLGPRSYSDSSALVQRPSVIAASGRWKSTGAPFPAWPPVWYTEFQRLGLDRSGAQAIEHAETRASEIENDIAEQVVYSIRQEIESYAVVLVAPVSANSRVGFEDSVLNSSSTMALATSGWSRPW
jgi:hypothetical protein